MGEKWNTSRIEDQSGRTAVVTGASSGIGYETAKALAEKNASVIIAVRNEEKGNVAAARIRADVHDANLRVMNLDLASLSSVREFAESFSGDYSRLDLLINNAGVMIPPYSKTEDGFELQFGTNHLGHFALTALLTDIVIRTPGSRVVNVSSNAHKGGNLDFDDLNWEKRRYTAWRAYSNSKIANLYFTNELDRRFKEAGTGAISTAAHPGWTATELQRHSGFVEFLNGFFAQDSAMGALPTLRAAVDPESTGGEYYGPSGFMQMRGYPKRVEMSERARDTELAKRLWTVSEEMTGIEFRIGRVAEEEEE